MKQQITVEQINELSDKGKEILREWWQPVEGDKTAALRKQFEGFNSKGSTQVVCVITNDASEYSSFDYDKKEFTSIMSYGPYGEAYPLLSIGQMIEFLDEKLGVDEWVRKLYGIESDLIPEPRTKTTITRYPRFLGWAHSDELCDALWRAVREVLEENV